MGRYLPWALLVIVILALVWMARNSSQRRAEDLARIAEIETLRKQAVISAERALQKADSVEAIADSLNALRESEKEEAALRARRLSAEADSLASEISAMVPEGEVRRAVDAAVIALRESYEERIRDLEVVINRSDGVISALQTERVELRRSVVSITDALEKTTEQRDLCMKASNPGFWDRLKSGSAALGAGLGVGLLAGILMG